MNRLPNYKLLRSRSQINGLYLVYFSSGKWTHLIGQLIWICARICSSDFKPSQSSSCRERFWLTQSYIFLYFKAHACLRLWRYLFLLLQLERISYLLSCQRTPSSDILNTWMDSIQGAKCRVTSVCFTLMVMEDILSPPVTGSWFLSGFLVTYIPAVNATCKFSVRFGYEIERPLFAKFLTHSSRPSGSIMSRSKPFTENFFNCRRVKVPKRWLLWNCWFSAPLMTKADGSIWFQCKRATYNTFYEFAHLAAFICFLLLPTNNVGDIKRCVYSLAIFILIISGQFFVLDRTSNGPCTGLYT